MKNRELTRVGAFLIFGFGLLLRVSGNEAPLLASSGLAAAPSATGTIGKGDIPQVPETHPVSVALPSIGDSVEKQSAPLYLLSYDHGGLVFWGIKHFEEKLQEAIAWLDRHPTFKIGLDNEAYTYDFLAERDPKLLEQLRDYLRKYPGRFGIATCTYGQPLATFINEESNIRQIAYAVRTDQKLLGYTPVVYAMSEHAMHSQIPQIVAGFGFQGALMRTHYMMYGYNPNFNLPVGWWTGLDGTRVPAVPTYEGEGAAFGRTPVDNWFLTRYPYVSGPADQMSPEQYRARFAHIRPLLASRLDDSGLKKEALLNEADKNPQYHWLLLDELFSTFPAPTTEMKTLPNDFTVRMPWGYCGNEIWNACRQAEVQVLTAERLAAFALLLGGENHEQDLDRAWKNLLVGQHHDVQIVGLVPEARRFLSSSIAESTKISSAALKYVAERMKGEGFAQVTAFNPLSWPRRQWMETSVALRKGDAQELQVKHEGRTVPSALLSVSRFSNGEILEARVAFEAELPPLGFASYSIIAAPQAGPSVVPAAAKPAVVEVDAEHLRVVTPFFDVRLDPHGGIAELVDRRTGKAMLTTGKRSGFFAGRINGVDCESRGQWTLHAPEKPAPFVVAREYGFIGGIPYSLEVTLHADSPQLDFRMHFHFEGEKIGQLSDDPRDARSPFVHEAKLRFKIFPATGEGVTGVRDLPFAVAPTNGRYVEGNYWTALAGTQGGVAFFNRGTMGSVREDEGGFSVPLAYAMYYVWGTRMLTGDYNYELAAFPFNGEWQQADLHRRAVAYNFPVVSESGAPGSGLLGESLRLIDAGMDDVLLSALYSENGKVLVRLYESEGRPGNSEIRYLRGPARVTEVDLLGRGNTEVVGPLGFKPWQFRTVRIETKRGH